MMAGGSIKMGRNRVLGSPYQQQVVTDNLTTSPTVDRYVVMSPGTGASPKITITLDPNAFNGDRVIIHDGSNNSFTYPITVVGTIIAPAGNVLESNGGSVEYTYNSERGGWLARSSEAKSLIAALGNWATLNAAPANTGADPDEYIVAAMPAVTSVTGVYRVDVTVYYSDSTVPEEVEWQLFAAINGFEVFPITHGKTAGITGAGWVFGGPPQVTATAGTPLGFGFTPTQITTINTLVTESSAVAPQLYAMHGIFNATSFPYPGAGGNNDFPIGLSVCFYLAVSAPTGPIEDMTVVMTVQEQPYFETASPS